MINHPNRAKRKRTIASKIIVTAKEKAARKRGELWRDHRAAIKSARNRGEIIKTTVAETTLKAARAPLVAAEALHNHDADYTQLRQAIGPALLAIGINEPVFQTNARDLFETYLKSLPRHERQIHNCNTCRSFIKWFGGLVTIDEAGKTKPLVWSIPPSVVPPFYVGTVKALRDKVAKAAVTGQFHHQSTWLGVEDTGSGFKHFAVAVPAGRTYRHALLSPGQAMAAKRHNFETLKLALADFDTANLVSAVTLLQSGALARASHFVAPAQWLLKLNERLTGTRATDHNLLWKAVALAPEGFCHPRAGMLGFLLEELAAGARGANLQRKWNAKVAGNIYQRPQTAPKAGNIKAAEDIVAKLGLQQSLMRRFATISECVTDWLPKSSHSRRVSPGVFDVLRQDADFIPHGQYSVTRMTWRKFSETILPHAEEMQILVPGGPANFIALTTAAVADAPPILRWDTPEKRNPVSWYCYHGGSVPATWNLTGGAWYDVTAVIPPPPTWFSPRKKDGVVLTIRGAMDSNTLQGNALFPNDMRKELFSIAPTIERYSKGAPLHGRSDGDACGLHIGHHGCRLRVVWQGTRFMYDIDRFE